jgi:hypothetical protein
MDFFPYEFLPNEDGLTLHVFRENLSKEIAYRLQSLKEQQQEIIEHFSEYVEAC